MAETLKSSDKTDKKEQILNAALNEFIEKGYGNASTNKIVKEANVSKGVLFYYFTDKEGLYNYLLEYVVDLLTEDIMHQMNLENPDFFDFLHESVNIKLLTIAKYPRETQFYTKAFTSDIPESGKKILEKNVALSLKYMNDAYKYFDTSLLKDGLESDKVIKQIEWACKGMLDDVITGGELEYDTDNYKILTKKIDSDFEFMRKLFYKEEM